MNCSITSGHPETHCHPKFDLLIKFRLTQRVALLEKREPKWKGYSPVLPARKLLRGSRFASYSSRPEARAGLLHPAGRGGKLMLKGLVLGNANLPSLWIRI